MTPSTSSAMGTPESFCGAHVLYRHEDHMLIRMASPCRVLSSAIVNGGFVEVSDFLNMRVAENKSDLIGIHEEPTVTVQRYGQGIGLHHFFVGMMTGANMSSIQVRESLADGIIISAALTSGISNARRAGDVADYCEWTPASLPVGTINIALATNAALTDAAMAEALMIVTEAKAALLQECHVLSPKSGLIATGTGTDATAIIAAPHHAGPTVQYCGKHTRFAEMTASVVMNALRASIAWQLERRPS